jgi:hypothetical protein
MLKYSFVFFLGLMFLFASCNKEVEVTPANIYGTWNHYYQADNYFQGMRFHENGDFQYLQKFGYDKEYTETNTDEGTFTFTLENKTVTIYRKEPGVQDLKQVWQFKIESLTEARLTEEGGYVWRRDNN